MTSEPFSLAERAFIGDVLHLKDPGRLWGIRCNRKHKTTVRTVRNPEAVTCRMCLRSLASSALSDPTAR